MLDGVSHRLVMIVAIHQDVEIPVIVPCLVPRPARSSRRGKSALGRQRLASGESNFALGHGKTSPHQCQFIGRRDDNDGARKAGSAKVVLQEFLDLAAALADQPDHRNIGRNVAGSRTDLPTPEPIPMRWPRQTVKVLSARTPRSSGLPTRRRECAGGGDER